jgi:uncharacterized protein (DUF1810 family)
VDGKFDLARFVTAQDDGGTYQRAVAELRDGAKRSHWMWFVFPQLAGLGRSSTAQYYGISGLPEARAYLAHPVLGARLRECCAILPGLTGSAVQILGGIDAVKLRSSVTLFLRASDEQVFQAVLDRFFDGVPDPATDELLG